MTQDKEANPMGVSQWKAYGKKYGYYDFVFYQEIERAKIGDMKKSNCCKATLMTSTSVEGTGFYYCAKCEKPCDQVVEGNDMIKHLMEVAGIKAGIEMKATEIASEKIEARLEKQKQAFLDIIDGMRKEQLYEKYTTQNGYGTREVPEIAGYNKALKDLKGKLNDK